MCSLYLNLINYLMVIKPIQGPASFIILSDSLNSINQLQLNSVIVKLYISMPITTYSHIIVLSLICRMFILQKCVRLKSVNYKLSVTLPSYNGIMYLNNYKPSITLPSYNGIMYLNNYKPSITLPSYNGIMYLNNYTLSITLPLYNGIMYLNNYKLSIELPSYLSQT